MVGEDRKLQIGGRVRQQGPALVQKALAQPHGLDHRPSADIQVKSVLQQRLELDAQQPAFGQQPAVPLDEVAEVLFQGILGV